MSTIMLQKPLAIIPQKVHVITRDVIHKVTPSGFTYCHKNNAAQAPFCLPFANRRIYET